MATKRKSTKTTSKKDLEAKIAQLEGKLSQLSAQVAQKPAGQSQTAPPPAPKPAETKPYEAPKPSAQTKAAPPVTLDAIIERVPTGNWNSYKAKTPGYAPDNARAWARRHPDVAGEVPTTSWTLQKSKISGYTAPSNRYFATKQRLAYHPAATSFTGYGVNLGHGTVSVQTQAPPPPRQDRAVPKETSSSGGGGSKKNSLEEYEKDYMNRLDQQDREAREFHEAAAELASKNRASSGSSSSGGSAKGSLPKGF